MSITLKHAKDRYDVRTQEMFSAVSDLYARYWGDFFHFAVFDDDEQSWEDAYRKTHEGYIKNIRLKDARNVIELACGRGGFSRILAESSQAQVLGVDISPTQLAQARRHRTANLRFEQHDIMRIDELGQTFDAVVCMDAGCYLPDKRKALAKIYQIMNPGARFLLIDWCKHEDLFQVQEEMVLHPFMQYWAVPGMETMSSYKKHLLKVGFHILDIDDRTEKVRKNWDRAYEQAIAGIRDLSVRDIARLTQAAIRAGRNGIHLIKEQFPAALYIKAGFDAGFLRYSYFLVEK